MFRTIATLGLIANMAVSIGGNVCHAQQQKPEKTVGALPVVWTTFAKSTTPNLTPEMAKLSRYVGSWSVTMRRQSENNQRAVNAQVNWVLGGRFLQSTYQGDGIHGMMLTTYDTAAKVYRRWQFDESGAVTEFTGRWDEAAKTLHFEHISRDDRYRIIVESSFNSDESREVFSMVVKDLDGQELDEFSGSSQRIR